ncbi:probable NADH dehydrogenase [ubiquinone] 1 alpha subcomplex subunit 12 [Battus philenor]|uniref:probable NADH dehydrogenase [ubiquinone] 1 alpha subcomplex subunit 12 n=1 Tax=Battus philenor TaxID=42288 RepID=UPI0035D0547B
MNPLGKISYLLSIISKNGGLFTSIYKMGRYDTLKDGKFVGTDSYGNQYFENPYYMLGRSRWVEFNKNVKLEYDGTQITPEWFGWIHYRTDRLPTEDCAKLTLKCCCYSQMWLQNHEENLSGTPLAYYPYSTTKCNIGIWDGSSICSRRS